LESLQGLDGGGRVIYVGTFSRTVFAALRVGYLIVPKALVGVFGAAKWLADRHTAGLEQRVLAEFIGSGAYELYLRRVRRSLAARRDTLMEASEAAWGNTMAMTGASSGAHVVLWLPAGCNEQETIANAAARDVGVYPVSGYFLGQGRPGLLLGYAQMSLPDIREGVRRLAAVLPSP
jgi:GntR family transcriptional regulator/MocR family aminotransferase